ncbi:citrate synthase-lysine N-methyltransferase CSKMT, mitochondrial-like isoform X2 [Myxocyprinus asiaticus]|uniref:citrate synthase-lysine N-methyltransferase CSKMT, mitochondrial-like isoform X2 n=1 Tax=Myxocyprinus asiaticus TaxID=70543 RepID=UPI002223AD2E|nr:citrate synthase-lysine N-methyltransferase CSKMT, mitochondrial-like isoform X2 [Myxocyprinus asiaticus]
MLSVFVSSTFTLPGLNMLLINRFAAPLRSLQKLTWACRWHHASLTNEFIENMDKKATWDRFYIENASKGNFKNFEWFFGFHSVQDFIFPVLQTMPHSQIGPLHILDMGCGTSALGPCIYRYSPCVVMVTCADISLVAVQILEEYTNAIPVQPQNPSSALAFVELDCTQLRGHFGARSLDLILDKEIDSSTPHACATCSSSRHIILWWATAFQCTPSCVW